MKKKGLFMGKIFNIDGPLVSFLSKVADLVWLNIIFIVFSLPIVTIGASTTAMYYVAMKMAKNEEGYIFRDFFKAFKSNFKQSSIIWLISATIGVVLLVNFRILASWDSVVSKVLICIICVIAIMLIFMSLYVYPLLARFENTVSVTMTNALLISLAQFPKTLLMIAFSVVPTALVIFSAAWIPLIVLGAFSIVAYTNSSFMVTIFKKFEQSETEEDVEHPDKKED